MPQTTITPTIFISYSWSSSEYEKRVLDIAERLISDGVDVVIDKWNLKEGQDKYNFMETMVKSPNIQKVLILLDKKYSEKAEQRKGGVGTETQIISSKIYHDVSQEKFVPVITEKDENGDPYLPTYLETRIFIDLSDDESFEENYEKLLRNIYKRPAYSKPKLGKAPSYLFEETPMTHKTSSIIRSFDNQITKSPRRINAIVREFLEDFLEELKGYSVAPIATRDPIEFGKIIHDNIISYTPLRNDYILFLDKLLKSELEFDIEIPIKFFENLPNLQYPLNDIGSWSPNEYDNFRFFTHEIFLYTIVIGLKNENYKFIAEILNSGYYFKDKFRQKNEPQRFNKLYNYVDIFNPFYTNNFSREYYSPMADLIIKRLPEFIDKNTLINADLLAYYISELDNLDWEPITSIYRNEEYFELFNRLTSQRHFEKVKIIFNVHTTKELRDKIESHTIARIDKLKYSRLTSRIPTISQLVDIDKIGTIR